MIVSAVIGAVLGFVIRKATPWLSGVKDDVGIRIPWPEAIGAALRPEVDAPDRREQRRMIARGYDWNLLTARFLSTLYERLDTKADGAGGTRRVAS